MVAGSLVTPTIPPPTTPSDPSPSPTATPTATPTPTVGPVTRVRVEVVASGLQVPWSLTFAPDGRLFFTERTGAVRVIQNGQLLPEPWAVLPAARLGEGGLLGLALDPQFATNGFVYLYYTYRDSQGEAWNRLSRLVERDGKGTEETVLLDRIPASGIHNGGRVKFGPDGKLYVTTGDAADRSLAQSLDSLAGKILRLNPDGSIPLDNPFPGSPVYSYGHRNPQGLAWHPVTGKLYATEHGPSAHDEVNIIEPGNNYGWPNLSGQGGAPQFRDPIIESGGSTWAPSGATFYTGGRLLPDWQGSLFYAALRGSHLHRLALGGPDFSQVQESEELFDGEFGRLRDVVQGPDGLLYFSTSNRDGRGSPQSADDRILRIVPDTP